MGGRTTSMCFSGSLSGSLLQIPEAGAGLILEVMNWNRGKQIFG